MVFFVYLNTLLRGEECGSVEPPIMNSSNREKPLIMTNVPFECSLYLSIKKTFNNEKIGCSNTFNIQRFHCIFYDWSVITFLLPVSGHYISVLHS